MGDFPHPQRRTSDQQPQVDPHLVEAIKNGVKLDNLISDFRDLEKKAEINYQVSMALQEHKTIERTDTLWEAMGEIRSSLKLITRLIVGFIGLIPVVVAVLTITHVVFHWPS